LATTRVRWCWFGDDQSPTSINENPIQACCWDSLKWFSHSDPHRPPDDSAITGDCHSLQPQRPPPLVRVSVINYNFPSPALIQRPPPATCHQLQLPFTLTVTTRLHRPPRLSMNTPIRLSHQLHLTFALPPALIQRPPLATLLCHQRQLPFAISPTTSAVNDHTHSSLSSTTPYHPPSTTTPATLRCPTTTPLVINYMYNSPSLPSTTTPAFDDHPHSSLSPTTTPFAPTTCLQLPPHRQ